MKRVERISSRDDVYVVRGPMCKRGMTATDRRGLQGTGFARKETGWMTNHPGLAELLETECANQTGGAPWHRHIHLIGGIAQQAAKYQPQLVRAVLKCLKRELEERGELNTVDAPCAGPSSRNTNRRPRRGERHVDDVNGGVLPKEEVEKARLRCRKSAHRCGTKHMSKSKCTKHVLRQSCWAVRVLRGVAFWRLRSSGLLR